MDREDDDDQKLVRDVLEERPDEELPDGFAARLAARLDEEAAAAASRTEPTPRKVIRRPRSRVG
jgi:hypothetical protein